MYFEIYVKTLDNDDDNDQCKVRKKKKNNVTDHLFCNFCIMRCFLKLYVYVKCIILLNMHWFPYFSKTEIWTLDETSFKIHVSFGWQV